MKAYSKVATILVGAAFLLGLMTSGAEARKRRGSTWVPNKAWNAVKKYARQKYDPRAKLFKTRTTKSQSRGLKGSNGKAWIVGAALPKRTLPPGVPGIGFRPYKPANTFFLVTRDSNRKYQVTPLGGMGGYISKVNAKADQPRVGVGVGLFGTGQVGHGVEVSNSLRLQVTRGTTLATKRNSSTRQTVFIKGDTGGQQWANNADANIRATAAIGGRYGGVPIPKDIPVKFSQVMFARPMASR